ncbi:hypothetical protein ACA910_009003 [Epithemia clementina (nom. ined.)]
MPNSNVAGEVDRLYYNQTTVAVNNQFDNQQQKRRERSKLQRFATPTHWNAMLDQRKTAPQFSHSLMSSAETPLDYAGFLPSSPIKKQQQPWSPRFPPHSLQPPKWHSCQVGQVIAVNDSSSKTQRRVTVPQVPDFILIGAQKCGTTALVALLEKHPLLVRSAHFEEHFFDMHYGVELETLQNRYPNETKDSLSCRLRTLYTSRLDIPSQIKAKYDSAYYNNSSENTSSSSRQGSSAEQQIYNQTFGGLIRRLVDRKEESNLNNRNIPDQGRLLTFEKTPFYLAWPHIPRALIETCPWQPRVIVMLRNPVDRLYSHYTMHKIVRMAQLLEQEQLQRHQYQQPTNFVNHSYGRHTLEHVLNSELKLLHKFGLSNAPLLDESPPITNNAITDQQSDSNNTQSFQRQELHKDQEELFRPPSISSDRRDRLDSIQFRGFGNHRQYQRFLQRGMYATQLQRWLQYYTLNENILVLCYEQFKANPRSVYNHVLRFLGVDMNHHPPDSTTGPNPTLSFLKEEDFRNIYRPEAQKLALFLLRQAKMEGQGLAITTAEPLLPSTRKYLEAFYRPYNEQLARLLGNDKTWLWEEEEGKAGRAMTAHS